MSASFTSVENGVQRGHSYAVAKTKTYSTAERRCIEYENDYEKGTTIALGAEPLSLKWSLIALASTRPLGLLYSSRRVNWRAEYSRCASSWGKQVLTDR